MQHPIPPLYDENSRILILGSFPSVRSREEKFFYAHKQNRFWKVLAALFDSPVPDTVERKKEFLRKNRIALWDVTASCSISGSADASIRDVVPNDITPILKTADIKAVFTNGRTAGALYDKWILPVTHVNAVCLPSTSPANASCSLEDLVEKWSIILQVTD